MRRHERISQAGPGGPAGQPNCDPRQRGRAGTGQVTGDGGDGLQRRPRAQGHRHEENLGPGPGAGRTPPRFLWGGGGGCDVTTEDQGRVTGLERGNKCKQDENVATWKQETELKTLRAGRELGDAGEVQAMGSRPARKRHRSVPSRQPNVRVASGTRQVPSGGGLCGVGWHIGEAGGSGNKGRRHGEESGR